MEHDPELWGLCELPSCKPEGAAPHRLGACVGGAPGEALGVCVVRGCRGKEKSRQFPAERAVYLRGASPVSATTVGFCSLHAANTL